MAPLFWGLPDPKKWTPRQICVGVQILEVAVLMFPYLKNSSKNRSSSWIQFSMILLDGSDIPRPNHRVDGGIENRVSNGINKHG